MSKYKTVVTDYEGMQGVLDAHAQQGWRLFSVAPDTWRRSSGSSPRAPFSELSGTEEAAPAFQEYSASYYLLVFHRDESLLEETLMASAEQTFPLGQLPKFED